MVSWYTINICWETTFTLTIQWSTNQCCLCQIGRMPSSTSLISLKFMSTEIQNNFNSKYNVIESLSHFKSDVKVNRRRTVCETSRWNITRSSTNQYSLFIKSSFLIGGQSRDIHHRISLVLFVFQDTQRQFCNWHSTVLHFLFSPSSICACKLVILS